MIEAYCNSVMVDEAVRPLLLSVHTPLGSTAMAPASRHLWWQCGAVRCGAPQAHWRRGEAVWCMGWYSKAERDKAVLRMQGSHFDGCLTTLSLH